METVRQLLDENRRRLLDLVTPLPSWDVYDPATAGWTIGQILHHLVLIEYWATATAKDLLLDKGPDKATLLQNPNKYPVKVVKYRKVKVPALDFSIPDPFLTRSELMVLLQEARERHLEVWEKAATIRDYHLMEAVHPLLGAVDLKGWLELPAYHEERHMAQIEEILQAQG